MTAGELVALLVGERTEEVAGRRVVEASVAELLLQSQHASGGPATNRSPRARQHLRPPARGVRAAAIAAALADFRAGRLVLFLDGHPITDPDQALSLDQALRIRLVRVLPLTGR